MSRKATDWAWGISIKPASLKLLLLSMADRADEYHVCYPSISRLVKDTCLDKKTVQSGLVKLMERKIIEDTGRRIGATGRVRVFRLIGLCGDTEHARPNDPNYGNVTNNGNIPNNGQKNDPNNGQKNDPNNGQQNQSIEPVNESLKDHTSKTPSSSPSKQQKTKNHLDFSSWPEMPSHQSMIDWLSVRKQKRASLNQTAVNRLAQHLNKAVSMGFSVDDCIATCASRGWVGFEANWLINAGVPRNSSLQENGFQESSWSEQVFDEKDPLI